MVIASSLVYICLVVLFASRLVKNFEPVVERSSLLDSCMVWALTGDVFQFGALPPGDLQFFRFVVDFDLDVMGLGVTRDTTPVSLEFLRLPLRF